MPADRFMKTCAMAVYVVAHWLRKTVSSRLPFQQAGQSRCQGCLIYVWECQDPSGWHRPELNGGREEPWDQGALLGFWAVGEEGTWVLGLRQCRLAGCTAEVPRMGLSAGIMAVWAGVG